MDDYYDSDYLVDDYDYYSHPYYRRDYIPDLVPNDYGTSLLYPRRILPRRNLIIPRVPKYPYKRITDPYDVIYPEKYYTVPKRSKSLKKYASPSPKKIKFIKNCYEIDQDNGYLPSIILVLSFNK